MKLKEFAQLDKYPYANENIRQKIAQNVKALDDVLEAIQNDPTITKEAKTLLKYQKGAEYVQKIAQSIQRSIETRAKEAKKFKEQFKSEQLRKEPLKEEQKAVMGIVYQELKSGNLDIFAKQNDNLLKIALTLADNGLIGDVSGQIDMMYSTEAVDGYLAQRELMEFEQSLLKELAEYEEIGLNKEEAMRIYHQTYKGQ